MKLSPGFTLMTLLGLIAATTFAGAQSLPGSLSFTTDGSFANGTPESSNSILITDNDLTNGYKYGFDLTDAPSALNPSGPAGSASFQWGTAATSSSSSSYFHPSALWFQPLAVNNALPEQTFNLGYLYYRNGTIKPNSGASAVDIALTMAFSQPLGIDPISVVFGTSLVNTANSSDSVASADIVTLSHSAEALDFFDAHGNRYYLELTFEVDQDTIDHTLSTANEFRVFEGSQGRATLQGRFTLTPTGFTGELIPEPSAALMGLIGAGLLLRRKR